MHLLRALRITCVFVFILLAVPCVGADTFWQTCKETVSTTWKEGRVEAIIPVNTWHNRANYTHEQVKEYNERPWGGGVAKAYVDEKNNRHRLLALVFQDSFDKPEPTFGYAWQAVWRAEHTLRPTLGFATGITFRDNYHWIPVPAIIPVVGMDVGHFSVETSYLIGFDVLFTWVTWRF